MGLIHIYEDISSTHESVSASGKLKDILPKTDFSRVIILKAGKRITADYDVTENDVIFIRNVPHGGAGLDVFLNILTLGIYGGVKGAIEGKDAKDAAERQQKQAKDKAAKIEKSAFLKGSRNRTALGQAIPFLIGDNYLSPYTVTGGFYTIEGERGEKQYWNAIMCVGYKDIALREIQIGNITVKKFSDGEKQDGLFRFDKDSPFYDENNIIDISDGTGFATGGFNVACKSDTPNREIKNEDGEIEEPVISAADNPMSIEVGIQFDGLRHYNTGGDGFWQARTVQIIPEWTNDNGKTWHIFHFSQNGVKNNTFSFNSNKSIRFVARVNLSYDDVFDADGNKLNIQVRCRKPTPKPIGETTNEACYVIFVNTYQFDVTRSMAEKRLVYAKPLEKSVMDNCMTMAVRIASTQNTESLLEEIHVIATGKTRVWDGMKWSVEKKPTSNIAAWILEIMTSGTHKLSRFNDSEIDLKSFGRFYEYCEENSFFCDGGIDKAIKKRDVIAKLLTLADATLLQDKTGLWYVAIDQKEYIPVALINSQDVTDIKVTKDFSRKPDGFKASWTSKTAWTTDTRYVMLSGKDYQTEDEIVKEQAFEFCGTAEHAWKIAQRQLRKQVLQPRTVTVDVGAEGDYYPLYSTVKLQTETLKIGLASSVVHRVRVNENNRITAIEIGDLVEFKEGKRYGVIIQAQSDLGREIIHAEVKGSGKTRVLELVDRYNPQVMPEYGNVLSFGFLSDDGGFEMITNVMKICDIKPGEKGFTLTLKDYDHAIYEYGDIPEYHSNLTIDPPEVKNTLPDSQLKKFGGEIISQATTAAIIAARKEKENQSTYVYMEQYGYTFYVDSNQNPESVKFKIPVHARKGEVNLPFWFGKIDNPAGISVKEYYEGERHGLIIETVPSGEVDENGLEKNLEIRTGMFSIPIFYADRYSFFSFGRAGQLEGEGYSFGRGEDYVLGGMRPTGELRCVNLRFSYSTSRAGSYRGTKISVDGFLSPDKDEQIANGLHIGDYFTWANEESAGEYYNGKDCLFKMSYVYRWNGKFWVEDKSIEHNAAAMSDILETANRLIDGNALNPTAENYFELLTANSFFCKRLVANDAFIQNIFTHKITIGEAVNPDTGDTEDGYIQSTGFVNKTVDEDGNPILNEKGEQVELNGFRISRGGLAEFYNLVVSGTTYLRGDTVAATSAMLVPVNTTKDIEETCTSDEIRTVSNGESPADIFNHLLWSDREGKLWFGDTRVLLGSDLTTLFEMSGSNLNVNVNKVNRSSGVNL